MRNYIRASRLLIAMLLVVLAYADLALGSADSATAEEMAGHAERPTLVTNRGGPRPTPEGMLRTNDTLVAKLHFHDPTPTPSPTPEPTVPPTPEPTLRHLGLFKITGYSDSPMNGTDGRGITRSGERTRWGVVAVDPRVIPLYSRLVIEGMGDTVFSALDTGGGIIGRWVDVWFPTDWEAIQHGVDWRNVYLVVK